MRILTLMENTCHREGLVCEHGLSLYIETEKHKLLFDTGASEKFAENAKALRVDLGQVDTVILSHGHYDHTGGMDLMRRLQPDAHIYIAHGGFGAYYHSSKDKLEDAHYIGIKTHFQNAETLHIVTGNLKLDEELDLVGGVTNRKLWPKTNENLTVLQPAMYGHAQHFIQDDFLHEQDLVIHQSFGDVLISGCSHNGIINILEKAENLYGKSPAVVIAGIHTSKAEAFTEKDVALIKETARELRKRKDTKYYVCHCTGVPAYEILREEMGNQIEYLSTGDEIVL